MKHEILRENAQKITILTVIRIFRKNAETPHFTQKRTKISDK